MAAVAGCMQGRAPSVNATSPLDAPALAAGVREDTINGVRHWYRVAGNMRAASAPVVFLHGGPGQGSNHFAALVGPRLEPSVAMVYFDQRGSGRSDRPADGAYSIARLVQDIEGLRRALGVPRIALIGHSFGAGLALEYAAAYPQHVSAVVFVAGLWNTPFQCALRLRGLAAHSPDRYERVRADTLADGARRSDCDVEFMAFPNAAERESYFNEMMFPDSTTRLRLDSVEHANQNRNTGEPGRALVRAGLLDYRFTALDRVAMPVLVIAGGRDGAAYPEGLRELAARLPDATFLEYPESGHFVHLDEPDRFGRHRLPGGGGPLSVDAEPAYAAFRPRPLVFPESSPSFTGRPGSPSGAPREPCQCCSHTPAERAQTRRRSDATELDG